MFPPGLEPVHPQDLLIVTREPSYPCGKETKIWWGLELNQHIRLQNYSDRNQMTLQPRMERAHPIALPYNPFSPFRSHAQLLQASTPRPCRCLTHSRGLLPVSFPEG